QFALTIAVSTLLSAFNSLTLSPALTALLLRPRREQTGRQGDKETRRQDPLPRLAFPLAGAWLAWQFLAPGVAEALSRIGSPSLLVSLSPCLLVVLGAAVGWLVSRPLNGLLGGMFRAFYIGIDKAT